MQRIMLNTAQASCAGLCGVGCVCYFDNDETQASKVRNVIILTYIDQLQIRSGWTRPYGHSSIPSASTKDNNAGESTYLIRVGARPAKQAFQP
jgi:hypothetical protein